MKFIIKEGPLTPVYHTKTAKLDKLHEDSNSNQNPMITVSVGKQFLSML
jgi:hypothetical protein